MTTTTRPAVAGLLLTVALSCSGSPPPAPAPVPAATAAAKAPAPAPAPFHRAVTTSTPEAQRQFDRGLLLCYGFNHGASRAAFEAAAAADPNCAMAFWGQALALGPTINHVTMDEAATKAALAALARARDLAGGASPVEQALIEALATRYDLPPADRTLLNSVYADAMRKVWHDHPDDPDVGALFAESLLDVRPWKQWRPDGQPEPGTLEAVAAIEAVLAKSPDHPGANHMAIHALEESPHPERALPAADRLRTLVPDSSHLLHMPAHIDMLVGHYGDAVAANQRAIAAADRDVAAGGNVFAGYRAHNHRHLTWAAMYDGQKAVALAAARAMVARLTSITPPLPPKTVEAELALPWHVLIRFGEWEAMLAEPRPAAEQKALLAFWFEARAVSLSSLHRLDQADAARADFEDAARAVPDDYKLENNSVHDLLAVARPFVEGELEYRRGRFDRTFELLKVAVTREDALHFDEPAGWMVPVRHALGALLLEQGRVADAEAVYREDLRHHPENGWSLFGLAACLRREGRDDEARGVDDRFRRAWARADVVLAASCYCGNGSAGVGGG